LRPQSHSSGGHKGLLPARAGFDGDEIDDMDLGMGDKEFPEMVRRRLVGSLVNNGNSQRFVGG